MHDLQRSFLNALQEERLSCSQVIFYYRMTSNLDTDCFKRHQLECLNGKSMAPRLLDSRPNGAKPLSNNALSHVEPIRHI